MEAPARLTEQQARIYIPASKDKLKSLRRERRVKYYRIGHRSVVYDRSSIDEYLDAVGVEQCRIAVNARRNNDTRTRGTV